MRCQASRVGERMQRSGQISGVLAGIVTSPVRVVGTIMPRFSAVPGVAAKSKNALQPAANGQWSMDLQPPIKIEVRLK